MPMSLPRHLQLMLGVIAFMAIAWAQAFGLHRGWMCDCGGIAHVTQVDHCHGPHSTACHDEELEHHSLPHHHENEDGDDRHEHAAVVESLLAKQPHDFSFHFAAPVKVLSVVEAWERAVPVSPLGETLPVPWLNETVPPREWPMRLARVISLRI